MTSDTGQDEKAAGGAPERSAEWLAGYEAARAQAEALCWKVNEESMEHGSDAHVAAELIAAMEPS